MSEQFRFVNWHREVHRQDIGFRRVLQHDVNRDFVKSFRQVAARVIADGDERLETESRYLLKVISDERNLYEAWEHLRLQGGQTPGPDGFTYADFDVSETWAVCREIRDDIRSRKYKLSREVVREIPKPGKSGTRPLILQSIFDRVVQRATHQILEPLIDPLYIPFSYGYRKSPAGGTARAVAMAEHLARHHRAWNWVSVDVKSAFTNVPIPRLLGVLRRYLHDERLIDFLGGMLEPDRVPGLRQGAPASPLFLNSYLHHNIDWPWRKHQHELPLIRFADDILLLAPSQEKATSGYKKLVTMVQDCGLRLKETQDEAIHFLDRGDSVVWMGFEIRCENEKVVVTIAEISWNSLDERFESAHTMANSPLAALYALSGWIIDKAPCFPHENRRDVYERVREFAGCQGFAELPTFFDFESAWQRAYARWLRTHAHEKKKLDNILSQPVMGKRRT